MSACNFLLFALMLLLDAGMLTPIDTDVDKVLETPKDCKDQTICDVKPKGYDELEQKMNNALTTHLQKDGVGSVENVEERTERLSPQSDWHNCPYITKTESLYSYRHGNESKIVVQTSLLKQTYTTVRCAYEYIPNTNDGKEQCFQGLGLRQMGIRSTCKTSFAKRGLYVYDTTEDKIHQIEISIPVCCSCVLSYDEDK